MITHSLVWLVSPTPVPSVTAAAASVPEWVTAGAAIIAVAISTWALIATHVQSRSAQARLVWSELTYVEEREPGEVFDEIDGPRSGVVYNGATRKVPRAGLTAFHHVAVSRAIRVIAVVHNGSEEILKESVIRAYHRGRDVFFPQVACTTGQIPPHGEVSRDVFFTNTEPSGYPPLGLSIWYQDARGRWWERHLAEPVRPLGRRDPRLPRRWWHLRRRARS